MTCEVEITPDQNLSKDLEPLALGLVKKFCHVFFSGPWSSAQSQSSCVLKGIRPIVVTNYLPPAIIAAVCK